MRPLVITGSSRSGTHWISEVFTAAGIPCAHEQVFGLKRPRPANTLVESAWLAVPWLRDGWAVGCQIRHPLKVVGSLLRTRSFSDLDVRYGRWITTLFPEIEADTEIERAANFWYTMTTEALRWADEWWRLEDPDTAAMTRLIYLSGRQVAPGRLEEAVRVTPASNLKPELKPAPKVGWAQVPSKIRVLAREVGYES